MVNNQYTEPFTTSVEQETSHRVRMSVHDADGKLVVRSASVSIPDGMIEVAEMAPDISESTAREIRKSLRNQATICSIFADQHPLRLVCCCGHVSIYETRGEFNQAGGEIAYHNKTDLFAVQCPSCSERRPAKVGTFDWGEVTEVCVSLGEFTEGYTPLDTSLHEEYELSKTDFSGVVDPVYIGRQHLDPTCLQCGERITDSDYHEGPDAPEIGWEYYKCSECGSTIRPEAIEAQKDDK